MPAPGAADPDGGRGRGDELEASARRNAALRVDQGLRALKGLVPLARRLVRLVGFYAAAVGAAGAAIVACLLWRFWPGSGAEWLLHLVVAAALLAPGLVLWTFQRALYEVLGLPERLVSVPSVARDHGAELAGLVRDVRGRRGGAHLTSLPRDLWRAGRLLLAAHDDLPGYGAVLAVVSVPYLLVNLVAAAFGLVVLVSAPVVVVLALADAAI